MLKTPLFHSHLTLLTALRASALITVTSLHYEISRGSRAHCRRRASNSLSVPTLIWRCLLGLPSSSLLHRHRDVQLDTSLGANLRLTISNQSNQSNFII
uniref:Secreted protein n=1 Tax=Anguilla anguilla TaxID=7936 RepID=A0A0E9Q3W9_ANGAN